MARGSVGTARTLAARTAALGCLIALMGGEQRATADTLLGEENGMAYVRDSASIAVGGLAGTQADCPPGAKALGGGADSVSTQLGGLLMAATLVDGGDPNSRSDDAFYADAYNSTGTAGETVAWVVCGPPGSRYAGAAKTLRFGATRAVKATCPAGAHVIGGGGGVPAQGDPVAQLKASRPFDSPDAGRKPDDGWLVRARNIGSERQFLSASAVCRLGTVSYFSDLTGLGTGAAGAGAPCADSALSASGAGGEIKGPGGTVRLTGILLADNTIEPGTVPDDTVVAEAQNFGIEEARYGPAGACTTLPP